MSVYKRNQIEHLNRNMFFDGEVDIARYDVVKYPSIQKLTKKQTGFFWIPQEVVLNKDSKEFKSLDFHEQFIFTSNLKRQILLDSVQGRAPSLAFLPICSLPELETFIQTWSFFETIHSQSYTHIIRSIYNNSTEVFDSMQDIKEIADCANDISKYYDELINFSGSPYEHKKALWMAMNAVNALEGIRFYVSFAASWSFAERTPPIMEGNAKIIKLIARDENLHLAATQQILKNLPKEDDDFKKIKEDCASEVISLFQDVVKQEKEWAKYLFQYGSVIGLNEQLMIEYVDWIAAKRMNAIGITSRVGENPLPWTQKWIGGAEIQVALQETENTAYIAGNIKNDIEEDTFSGFKL